MSWPFRSLRMNLAYVVGRRREQARVARWKEVVKLQHDTIEEQHRLLDQLTLYNNILQVTLVANDIPAPEQPTVH